MSWAENMAEIRKVNGDTQADLAKKLGWSRPQIQRYEAGDYPTLEYLIAFCNEYKVLPNDILREEIKLKGYRKWNP